MKNMIFVIIAVILQSIQVSSQVRDSLIQLTPSIGDTITISENDFFNFYPYIKGFRYAILYIRDNDSLVNHIYYITDEEEIRDTVIIQGIVLLDNKRAYIQKYMEIYSNKDAKLVTVTTNYGTYTGNLLYVDDEELILKATEIIEESEDDFLSVPTKEINHILIPGNSNIGVGAGVGFLSGFAIGFIIGLADGSDPPEKFLDMTSSEKGLTAGIVLGLGGLILGTVIGLVSSSWDKDIDINSDYDFNKLKKYSKFQTIHPGYYISTD